MKFLKKDKDKVFSEMLVKLRSFKKRKVSFHAVHDLDRLVRSFLFDCFGWSRSWSVHELLTRMNQEEVSSEVKVEVPLALIKFDEVLYNQQEVSVSKFDDLLLQARKAVRSVQGSC